MDKKKWQVVEEIVASLFKDASVTIEKNKRLKSIRRNEVKAGYRVLANWLVKWYT